MAAQDTVLVLDFGSQYTQLIARRIREIGVYSEVKPCTTPKAAIDWTRVRAVILSGGPASVMESDAPAFDKAILDCGVPVLGVCYGMQLMAHLLGGEVGKGESREFGHAVVTVAKKNPLFGAVDTGEKLAVWMSHGDHVTRLPNGFVSLAESEGAPVAAFGNDGRKMYGVQFHPEVVHTPCGRELLSQFVLKISGIAPNWDAGHFISTSVESIAQAVPADAQVICGLSGGVDSTVAAVLVHRAIGKRLHCIFVDNGLLRRREAEEVVAQLGASGLGLNLIPVNASSQFLAELRGVSDPEKKRKAIGRVFIDVFDAEAKKIRNVSHLVQGTLYPDVIESVSVRGPSATIKTHHNVGGLPEKMNLKLIEPLRELFKDEVRVIGRELGVPEGILGRHPFPGPGLAIRILGEIDEARIAQVQHADAIFIEEIKAAGLYNAIWQAFAAVLPVKSVGVMGDCRTYENTVALRAVTSEDGMTADWADLPYELLKRTSSRIINEVRGVNRVVLDISSKPPSTIEWE